MTRLRKQVTIIAPFYTKVHEEKEWPAYNTREVVLSVPSEKWHVEIGCVESGKPDVDLEQAEIVFSLPNGKSLKGNIQQFQTLEAIVYNALGHMKDFSSIPMTDKKEEASILDSCKELEAALSMFSKPQ